MGKRFMITNDILNEVILQLDEEQKQRILASHKEYCVLYLHIFNAGSFTSCTLTNYLERYSNVSDSGNAICYTSKIQEIIEYDNDEKEIQNNIAENIANLFKHLDGKQNRKGIFTHYRRIDPGCAEKAIQELYYFEKTGGYYLLGLELCLFLEAAVIKSVNSQY
jgi:hypothetical protein